MLRHFHYLLMNLLLAANLGALLIGGQALWFGFVAGFVLSSFVDEAAGEDRSAPESGPQRLLEALLFLTLPLLALNLLALLLVASPAVPDAAITVLSAIGIDLVSTRAATGFWSALGGVLGLGLFIGAAGTNVAHELVHRTNSHVAQITGRWLLAFSFDTTFSIEHVHGHHRHVCTPADPATARRGEYPLAFFVRSTIGGNISAVRIETDRLRRKGLGVWSLNNRVITGQLMSLTLLLFAFAIGGWGGGALFALAGIQGKFYLELVNYIEHYGLVRAPGARIEARHAWNTYHRISSGLLYNLPRHSHHHMFATKPFWTLEIEPEGPTYPHGYMTMMIMSLVPPLWRKTVDPLLAEWDRSAASDPERAMLARE
ncbi:MAG: alkane 1-monooxygenase, partial [Beijerinckiaceae bacterium]